MFGVEIHTGPHIDWHRDYRNGKTSGNDYFRRIPYLDMESVGDHKWIWELNRHQHLIVLAQAHLLTGRYEFISEIEEELTSWLAQNPFVRGINWVSALEVAFRALSVWIDLLTGDRLRDRSADCASKRIMVARQASRSEPFGLLFAEHTPAGRSGGASRHRPALSDYAGREQV